MLLLALFSCRSGPTALRVPATESWKDSILKRHLAVAGQVPFYDTTNVDFKMMRAYEANDSAGLTKMEANFESRVDTYTRNRHFIDSCTKQTPIDKLNGLEAYRFDYSGGLCPYSTSLTIVRYADSIRVNTLVYQMSWDGSNQYKQLAQYTIRLDSLRWADFRERLEEADFWGLKPDNDKNGLDGFSLHVSGFKDAYDREPAKYGYVYRWCPHSGIMDCFRWLIKVAKCKKGCVTAN